MARLEENDVSLRELDTRYYLIDPILKALNWDLSDPAQVQFEWPMKNGYIDYVLFDREGEIAICLEAKRGDKWLGNEDIVQLREYVRGRKLGLAVLTNGAEWKIYDLSHTGRFDSISGKKVADFYYDLPEGFWEEEEPDEDEYSEDEGEEFEDETDALSVEETAKLLYQFLGKRYHW